MSEIKKRIPLVLLNSYELVITQSFEINHGISGHLFEMIEYFYHLKFIKKINCCILICDNLSEQSFFDAIYQKYNFSEEECHVIESNIYFKFQPKVVICNSILFVDGSLRNKDCDLLAKKIIFFRCSDNMYLDKADVVLQDYDIYPELNNSMHYKKKILFSKFKKIKKTSSTNIGMFYINSHYKKMSFNDIENTIKSYIFDSYLILSNEIIAVPDRCIIEKTPFNNLWESFDTYIYFAKETSKIDCSPRFVAECNFYKKDVIYNRNGIVDIALDVRIADIEKGIVELKDTDDFYSKI